MKTAFLGPRGTFSEEAAIAWSGPDADLIAFPSFPLAAAATERGETDVAVLPIYNSIEGGVSATLDLLIQGTPLRICGEIVLPVRHFLVTAPGSSMDRIAIVTSHPQALGQCRQWLQTHLPNAGQVAALSTAASVADAAASDGTIAGIGTRRAAALYNGFIIAEAIEDDRSNMTRFIALSHHDTAPTGADLTSLCFTTHVNVPGSLHGVLSVFADAGLQLTRIESRPIKHSLGEYYFLIDIEGHQRDPDVAAALDRARARCLMLTVFGSYPRFPLERIRA
ncbi:MAG: prephenate dehydratase [Thermomicrobiales bacterium]